jgi:membrane protein implicated in regulation of membrane protease activity
VSDTRPPVPSRGRRPAPSRGLWIAITLILLPAIVLPLWVPLYDKVDPRLNGWPFFFWFQMAMILFATALTVIAYSLSRVADRRDREARGRGGDVS